MRYELRDMEIYEKWIRGTPQAALAEEYNLSVSRISLICTDVRRSMPQQSREDLIALSVDQLEFLREKVIELVQMNGAPVTAGQMGDVVLDPETGEVVRDYSLRLRAIQAALAMNQTLAKRLGLDAPAQTESVVKATVQYEIVGVDPGELT